MTSAPKTPKYEAEAHGSTAEGFTFTAAPFTPFTVCLQRIKIRLFFLRRSVPPEEFYQRGSALSAGAAQEMMGKEREESED